MRCLSHPLPFPAGVRFIVWLIGFASLGGVPLGAQTVRSPTMVSLNPSANPVFLSNPFALQATVVSAEGSPTGMVSFYDVQDLLGSATMDETGKATLVTSIGTVGVHLLTAVYGGTAVFEAGSSAAVPEVIEDFGLSSPVQLDNNTCECHLPVGTSIYRFTLSPVGGAVLPTSISLSVSGLPSGVTGTLSPGTIASGASPTPIILTLQSQRVAGRTSDLPRGLLGGASTAMLLPFILTACYRRERRPSLKRTGLAFCHAALIGAASAMMGCGATGRSTASSPTPTAPSYTVTVTATAGSLQHNAYIAVTGL